MLMNKLSELKAAAQAATPGPWSWKVDGIFYYLSPEGVNTPLERIIDDGSAWGEYAETIEHDGPDARFIAAANPATVLALLAELEAKDHAHRVHAARLISERGVLRERVTELEAKLATPVRLPPLMDGELFGKNSGIANAHNNAITACSIAIRGAGFKSEATSLKCVGDKQ